MILTSEKKNTLKLLGKVEASVIAVITLGFLVFRYEDAQVTIMDFLIACLSATLLVCLTGYLALRGKKSNTVKNISRAAFVIMVIFLVIAVSLWNQLNCEAIGYGGVANVVSYSFGQAISIAVFFACMIDKHEMSKQTVLFLCMIVFCNISLFAQGLMYSLPRTPFLIKLLVYVEFTCYILSTLLMWLCGQYIRVSLDVPKTKYRIPQLYTNCISLGYGILSFCSLWTGYLFFIDERGNFYENSLGAIIGAFILTAIYYFVMIIKQSEERYQKFALCTLVLSIISVLFSGNAIAGVTLTPMIFLLGIIICFTNVYVKRSNSLIETKKDLNFAASIQLSMLPREFKFKGIDNVKIFASMNPAKDVGGDFYDFFKLDDKHVAFLVADVSGKGPSAALIMMRAITAIKNFAVVGLSVDKLMEMASKTINEHNDAMLFVTCWMGMLNTTNGRLRFVNAGHNPPYIRHADGSVQEIKSKPDMIMGFFDEVHYVKNEIFIEPGDTIFLYTDGITEALNEAEEQYGTKRLVNAIELSTCKPKQLIHDINDKVTEFVGKADQFDDMTMLAINYDRPKDEVAFFVPATKDNVDVITNRIDAYLEERKCPARTMRQIDIAVDEIFSNIANYAYGDGVGQCNIILNTISEPNGFRLIFIDEGSPYNPLERKDPSESRTLEERSTGGFGVYIVKKTMDNVAYRRTDTHNVFTIEKYFVSGEDDMVEAPAEPVKIDAASSIEELLDGLSFDAVDEEVEAEDLTTEKLKTASDESAVKVVDQSADIEALIASLGGDDLLPGEEDFEKDLKPSALGGISFTEITFEELDEK